MKILVISDVHANLTALEAVLAEAGAYNAAWCLGDLVGYGPDGNECVQRVRSLPNLLCVRGNHDLAICGDTDLDIFNHEASEAIRVSRQMMTPETLLFLHNLPEVLTTDLVTLVHGSPRNPVWEYILDTATAAENIISFNTPLAFVGHSHLPLMFTADNESGMVERSYIMPGKKHYLSNRTIFGIFDPEEMTWEIHRVVYDVPAVQKRILEAGLPEKHARRLSAGW